MEIESVVLSIAETQSFQQWVLAALLRAFMEVASHDSDFALLERLCRTVSSAAVHLHTLDAK